MCGGALQHDYTMATHVLLLQGLVDRQSKRLIKVLSTALSLGQHVQPAEGL